MYRIINAKRTNAVQYAIRRYTLSGGRIPEHNKSVIGINTLKWQLGNGGGTRAVYSQFMKNSMKIMPVLNNIKGK